jgi:hypothetical protein
MYGVKNGENFDQSWGGLPVVIFLGDDVQLSPVLDSPVYSSSFKLPAALEIFAAILPEQVLSYAL